MTDVTAQIHPKEVLRYFQKVVAAQVHLCMHNVTVTLTLTGYFFVTCRQILGKHDLCYGVQTRRKEKCWAAQTQMDGVLRGFEVVGS
jgi:hypothetical protein